jgi:hypothetical protein
VRARLRTITSGSRIQFICDTATADKMDRVIIFADGKIISKTKTADGIIIVAEKT